MLRALARLGCKCIFCDIDTARKSADEIEPGVWVVPREGWARVVDRSKPLVVLNSHAKLTPTIARYRPDLSIFWLLDLPVEQFVGWAPDIEGAVHYHQRMVCTAAALQEAYPQATLIRNGSDYAHFATSAPRPADMPAGTVAVFSGAIAPWCDWEGVQAMARANPDWTILLLGSEYEMRCPVAPNIVWLGHKPYADLPGYLQNADVALMPFRVTPMTNAVSACKLGEYLAAGTPVLSTPIREVVDTAVDVVQIVPMAQWPTALASVPTYASPEARQAFARANTWDMRAADMLRVIVEGLRCVSPSSRR
jgi:glycosyltransferase involved in cell wall biosynthesis